jgi:pimeloyl-ACP methyl ester carboxylesterase
VLTDRLAAVPEKDDEPTSLVGISAGGIVAREFARRRPDLVRQVITVGSPFRFRRRDTNRMSAITRACAGRQSPSGVEGLPREELRPPLSMPVAAVDSRTDGLVDWRTCREMPG